jgi:general secretion pathway protein H
VTALTPISTCLNFSSRMKTLNAGFTLIEILVVMLIVSILMGVVVTQLPATSATLEIKQESERLVTLLTMASDEAIIRGSELGFDVDRDLYTFYEFRDETEDWVVMEDAPYQARQVGEGIELSLRLEGRKSLFETEGKVPPILLLSSGEVTPFDLTVYFRRDSESAYIISTDGFSGFSVEDTSE